MVHVLCSSFVSTCDCEFRRDDFLHDVNYAFWSGDLVVCERFLEIFVLKLKFGHNPRFEVLQGLLVSLARDYFIVKSLHKVDLVTSTQRFYHCLA
jgi:hypothetical protein